MFLKDLSFFLVVGVNVANSLRCLGNGRGAVTLTAPARALARSYGVDGLRRHQGRRRELHSAVPLD